MNLVSSLMLSYAVNALWQVPLLVLAGEAPRILLPCLEARALHRVWLSCFVLALVIPGLPGFRSFAELKAPRFSLKPSLTSTTVSGKDREDPSRLSPGSGVSSQRALLSRLPIQVSTTVSFVYFGSVLFALIRLGWGLWRTRTLLRTAEPAVLSPDCQENWTSCLGALGLKRTGLVSSTRIVSPTTISWPGPLVIFPAGFCQVTHDEVKAAFCHELAHVRRKDFLINLLCESLGIFLFFHPALHWIRSRIQETRELACDDLAASAMPGRNSYARNLLRLARRIGSNPATSPEGWALGIFEGGILEKRIMNLLKIPARHSRLRTWISIGASLSMLIAVCVLAASLGLHPAWAATSSQTDHSPAGWFLAGNKPQDYRSGVDKEEIREAQPSAYLQSTAPKIDGFGTLMQSIAAGNYTGKRIRLRAWVKSREVSDWAGLWMRVDKGQTMLAFDNMQQRPIKGTRPWKMYDVVLDVPEDATGISFGVLLGGTGEVWMNHVSFEEVNKNVSLTSSTARVPANPGNLNFTQ